MQIKKKKRTKIKISQEKKILVWKKEKKKNYKILPEKKDPQKNLPNSLMLISERF